MKHPNRIEQEFHQVLSSLQDFLLSQKEQGVLGLPLQHQRTTVNKDQQLENIRSELGECTRCKLHQHRRHIVFGTGNPAAQLVFVGEGPGGEEDVQGKPFVGL